MNLSLFRSLVARTVFATVLPFLVFPVISFLRSKFEPIYEELGASLPQLTIIVLSSSWWVLLVGILSCLIGVLGYTGILNKSVANLLLAAIIILLFVYTPITILALYLPMFNVIDLVG